MGRTPYHEREKKQIAFVQILQNNLSIRTPYDEERCVRLGARTI